MKGSRHPGKLKIKTTHGFTLIEVMIVMVIVAILATSVVFMFANPNARVKTQAFNLLGELNMARSEAVNRNEDVLVEFLDDVSEDCQDNIIECSTAGNFDGYIICVDLDVPLNNLCESSDTIIRITLFDQRVQYYDPAVLPDDGPSATSGGGDLIGGSGIVLDDDTAISSIIMTPDGTLEDTITENANVVIYLIPEEGDHNKIRGTPYAVTIMPNSGASINRWLMGNTWFKR